MPSSQGVTNLPSRGPGAVIRRAVTHEAKAARDAPATGAPSAIPLARSLLTTRLLRSVLSPAGLESRNLSISRLTQEARLIGLEDPRVGGQEKGRKRRLVGFKGAIENLSPALFPLLAAWS